MILQILAVSCLAVFVHAQIDVQSCTSYTAAADKCNADYSITGGMSLTWGSVLGFYSLPGNVYCNATNKENFMKLAKCIQEAYIACAKNDFHKFVASADGIKDGVEYYCNNYADFDVSCISELGSCASDKAPANRTIPTMTDGFDKNKEYYCGFGILVNGQFVKLDTSSCKNFNDTINNCVTNYSVIGIPRQDARTVQQFFSSIEPSVYCSSENNANFKSLLSCIVTAYRTCAGGKFQTLLATGESYKQAIDEVCRRKDGFNVTCTYNSNSCARTNIERKGLTQPETYTPFSDQKTVYCGFRLDILIFVLMVSNFSLNFLKMAAYSNELKAR
ncbi:hypothetical protein LOTGIDRAFT_233532 [Lottia gigantea]|uniref:DUF19 domain-containing protein n=1 Tax=Lottia gigantea TaxID=225164 RepID=V4BQA4_LOTGI|nr:hypothetical protein LOTGIDRAFT_233532 [Lottia gigantea]ESO91054.1 hypothetical protein LOTGIDRAFT_233532 [Lottia gigantea]